MSHFLRNEACPKCRSSGGDISGDNLGVYSDGHSYCWKCGFYNPGDIKDKYFKKEPITNSRGLIYPEITSFSKETIDYLKKYGLTDDEIYSNLNGHTEGYSFFDSAFYQVRRINPIDKPKVDTRGIIVGNEPIFASSNGGDSVVLVEDIISSIKVSRVIDSCALLKSSIHDILILRLANRYKNCYLWLDPDMYQKMTKSLLPRLKPYFNQVRVIFSELDPKEYSTQKIKEYLR